MKHWYSFLVPVLLTLPLSAQPVCQDQTGNLLEAGSYWFVEPGESGPGCANGTAPQGARTAVVEYELIYGDDAVTNFPSTRLQLIIWVTSGSTVLFQTPPDTIVTSASPQQSTPTHPFALGSVPRLLPGCPSQETGQKETTKCSTT